MKTILAVVALCFLGVFATPENDANTVTLGEPGTTSYSKQGTVQDRQKLLKDLFQTYNNKVNPDAIKLKFGVYLMNFKVCEKDDALESVVWLRYSWDDQRLVWDPEEYGGAEVIRLDPREIWTPDVTLYNTADPVNMVSCNPTNVVLRNNGTVLWIPPCKIVSQCTLNLRKEPYGEQNCSFKFGSWTFDGNIMDLRFYDDSKPALELSELRNSSGFEITRNVATRHVRYYSCCEEPYEDLTFNITIKRLPGEELFHKF